MKQFNRMLDPELVNKLKDEKLFNEKLKRDIKTGEVFFAIRENKVDFYHNGGRVFTYDGKFKTHIKYASVGKMEEEKDYVSLEDLRFIKFCNFIEGYERIKENCSLYSGVEALGVSKIYENHSYVLTKSENLRIVVLDIEVSFKAREEDRSQNRIDILLFEKEKKRLIFCEAKHFSNGEIWAEKAENIKVVKQIRRYTDQIKDKDSQIIAAYKNYVNIVNDLFQIALPAPDKICLTVPLIIFGFDRDQLKGRFKDLFKEKIGNAITYYPIGNVLAIKLENLIKQCNL